MENGDIYRWAYKSSFNEGLAGREYAHWCRSNIAIFNDGRLLDTFWMGHGGIRHGSYGPVYSSGKEFDADNAELFFIANLRDLVEIYPEDKRFYAPSDVVDLRHSNNTNAPVMVRAGAQRSRDVTRDLLLREIEKAKSEADYALRKARRLEGELDAINQGGDASEVSA